MKKFLVQNKDNSNANMKTGAKAKPVINSVQILNCTKNYEFRKKMSGWYNWYSKDSR